MSAFLPAALERAARVVRLLEEVAAEPELSARIAVGGGAALHLARPDPWRLTADLDLHHVSAAEGEALRDDVARTEALLEGVVARSGYHSPMRWSNETGVRWLLPAETPGGGWDPVRLDLTLLTPVPVWPLERMRPYLPGGAAGPELPRLAHHELVGNKLSTLFIRRRSRDLYDAYGMLTGRGQAPDPARARIVFLLGLAARPKDPRPFDAALVGYSAEEMRHNLLPWLPAAEREAASEPAWGERLLENTREAVRFVVPLAPHEREFVTRLRDHAEVRPELLTSDAELAERIRRNGTVLRPPRRAWGLE